MTPLLLLIPGMNNTPRVWDRVREHLTVEVEVRVTDIRASHDIPAMAAAAWGELSAFDASRPLALAGYSMGGHVALQMIATAPRSVQGLALVCSSATPESPSDSPMRERAIASAQRNWDGYVSAIANHLASASTRANGPLMEAIVSDLREAGVESTVAQHRAAASRPDNRALLPTLQLQALVLAGAEDSRVPLAAARHLAAAIPAARLVEVPGAGHLLPSEQPELVAAEMDRWLNDILFPRPRSPGGR